jgi:hypothetical protein
LGTPAAGARDRGHHLNAIWPNPDNRPVGPLRRRDLSPPVAARGLPAWPMTRARSSQPVWYRPRASAVTDAGPAPVAVTRTRGGGRADPSDSFCATGGSPRAPFLPLGVWCPRALTACWGTPGRAFAGTHREALGPAQRRRPRLRVGAPDGLLPGAWLPVGVVPAAARTRDLRTLGGPFGTDGRARPVMQWNRRGQRQDGEVIDAPGLGNAR